jgi:TRAP-type uncharacterized transport system substrate-binding protein
MVNSDDHGTSTGKKRAISRLLPPRMAMVSWPELAQTLLPILIVSAAAIWLALRFVQPAPPKTLTIASGPPGSAYERTAQRYREILARNDIDLKVVSSAGSLDNLQRLADPATGVDIALVQSGVSALDGIRGDTADLVSLGGLFYQPMLVFYRSSKPMMRLSELSGKRVAIGPGGSGTRVLALELLKANQIEPLGATELLDFEGEEASNALLHNEADAVFLSGDSASRTTINALLHADGIRLFDFSRADAYVRRFAYLSKLDVPAGAFDLGEDIPATDIRLIAPTVELLAHDTLHPALCDLLIEAAIEVHSRASLLQQAGQFPNPTARTFPIASEAARYYKSGDKNITYRYLPFWLASLLNRALVVLVPIIVVVIPGLRFLPTLYRWRVDNRIYRRYGQLMAIEREAIDERLSAEQRAALLQRLVEVERDIIAHKIPGSHAGQLYVLRQHINFVRANLAQQKDSHVTAEPDAG